MSNITTFVGAFLLHPAWLWTRPLIWQFNYLVCVYLYSLRVVYIKTFYDVMGLMLTLSLVLLTVACFWAALTLHCWEVWLAFDMRYCLVIGAAIVSILVDILLLGLCIDRLRIPTSQYITYLCRRYKLERDYLEAFFARHALLSFPLDRLSRHIHDNPGYEESLLVASYVASLDVAFEHPNPAICEIRDEARRRGLIYNLGIPYDEAVHFHCQ